MPRRDLAPLRTALAWITAFGAIESLCRAD